MESAKFFEESGLVFDHPPATESELIYNNI